MTSPRVTVPTFLTAEGLSLFADSALLVVLPWLALTITGRASTSSLVLAAVMVPAVVTGIAGGYAIDRLGRRRSSVVASLGSAAAAAALAIVDGTGGLGIGTLIAFGLLATAFGTPAVTARDALMADVARSAGVSLERVAGLRQGVSSIAFLGGPAVAGLLLATVPSPLTLSILVACWVAASAVTAVLPLSTAPRGAAPAVERVAWWRRITRDPVVVTSIVIGVGSGVITAPLSSVVLPAHFRAIGEPAFFGVAVALSGAGSLVGSILYSLLARRRPGWTYAGMIAITTAGFALVAMLPAFPLVLTGQFAIGLGAGVLGPFVIVAITRHTEESERGRVLGVFNSLGLGASPAGLAVFAPLVAATGIGGGAVAVLVGWGVLALLLIAAARPMLGHGRASGDGRAAGDGQASEEGT